MNLKETIQMLSKSSAYAVSTLGDRNVDADKIKDYLYIETKVEKKLREELENKKTKQIIFLCGSSGDGKSEIFRRIHKEFAGHFHFHLDATHSFDPNKNAIQTLDALFNDYKNDKYPQLVVGINIGMLGNYEADGSGDHQDLKNAIGKFLRGEFSDNDPEFTFINFEDYPKFDIKGKQIDSLFIGALIKRVCEQRDDNPFYYAYKSDDGDSQLKRNYLLLSIPEVQSKICDLLFYAHLQFDQFLTARTILDFVYQIVAGKGNLTDNLFCSKDSELLISLGKLDPCHVRSKSLDLFQMEVALKLSEPDFEYFKTEIKEL